EFWPVTPEVADSRPVRSAIFWNADPAVRRGLFLWPGIPLAVPEHRPWGHAVKLCGYVPSRRPMLKTLREKISSWIAIVIVAILAIPFAFFGMEQYLFQSGGNYAAKIEAPPSWWRSAPDWWPVRKLAWNSVEVSPEEFRTAFENERQRRREMEGER